MARLNPQLLTTFSTIVSAGSISSAATRLECGKSVVSRQLARLESDLGARLLQRSTRKLTLTEVGKVVLVQAQQIDRALSNVAQISGQFQQQVRGPLRIACPRPLGQRHLVPLITEFTQLHPLVEVTLLVEDRMSDLIAEQIDVAIRVAQMEDSTLVARKLADNPRVLVAAPAYLQRAGTPRLPKDLPHHECLLWTREGRVFDEWPFNDGTLTTPVRVQGRIRINDGMALVASACSGAGITVLDRLLVADELARGTLVELLPQYTLPSGPPIYAVYPARQWLALNTSTFLDFLLLKGLVRPG
ncbi:MAG: LysR family transcriptional regulator [Burkholderiaceae bacterium]|nr:LysR family transcriptional regulator [Burkholderiaceae bacterium]